MPDTPITKPKPKRRGGAFITIILVLGLIAVAGLFIWTERQRREVAGQLQATEKQLEEIRASTEQSGQQVANQVLEKIRRHMEIPAEPAPTVATIVDIERLRESNDFYKAADNGDHLIITDKRAILYDPERDLVIDVVPVRINPSASVSPAPGESVSPAPSGSPDPAGGSPSPAASVSPASTPATGGASPAANP